ncbi:MAG: sensor histidine kinase, partial [Thiohalomonadales bacterium]
SQVLENLIGNAMKFSPQNTCTVIHTRHDEEYVYAEIVDEGPGITDEDKGFLFKKNAHLTNKPTGNESSSGIGLSLSKQMIDMHYGKIGAMQNEGKGATFWFSLPIKARKAS